MTGKRNKRRDLVQLALIIAIIFLLNFVSQRFFMRFDLTTEKKFTLNEKTTELLQNLDDIVYFRVYLEGDFNPDFDRLKAATREMLDEFRAHSNNNLEYEFIDPLESPDPKEQESLIAQLQDKGITPYTIQDQEKGGTSQKFVLPGAIATYKQRETSLQLYEDQLGYPPEIVLNNSIEGLEYQLSNAIRKLQIGLKPRIAFLQGHGELDSIRVADFTEALREYYEVQFYTLTGNMADIEGLKNYKALIIAQPDSAFTEPEKFILDQYLMHGGRTLWMIDKVNVSGDSLARSVMTYGLEQKLRLDDLFFKYGIRVNADLVQDFDCAPLMLPVGGQKKPFPFIFYPLAGDSVNTHPISKNIYSVRLMFGNSIDTVGSESRVKKTVLLSTSQYANSVPAPARVDLRIVSVPLTQKLFKYKYLPVAVLLEGEFASNFRYQPAFDSLKVDFRDKSVDTKMIVIADGDVAFNYLNPSTKEPFPCGFDMFSGQMFGNKTFLLNAMNYLCGDGGLLAVRSRKVDRRMLDAKRVEAEKVKWQLLNTAGPISLVVLFGVLAAWRRKKKYAS
ncbi:MAG: gliding motility-associated ABC transporter substrate-binding protein GldG [Bacteroidota bacterium]